MGTKKNASGIVREMRELAGVGPLNEQDDTEMEDEGEDEDDGEDEGDGEDYGDVGDAIAELRDTEYGDKEGYLEMSDLLGSLADVSDEDDVAAEFLSLVSEALYDAAVKVLGEE